PPRKRQRLVHLSTEEKASRRYGKNRVAAQSARDRKMALMCDLEKKAEELRAKNRLLVEKNRALKAQSLNLAQQNLELRRRLSKDVFEEQECDDLFGLLDELDMDLFGDVDKSLGQDIEDNSRGSSGKTEEEDSIPTTSSPDMGSTSVELDTDNDM
uniref:X-box-binding protein 1 n=1 Tax=Petromyzon marinus TaxID=7757 RepID=S4RQQ7_PETMA